MTCTLNVFLASVDAEVQRAIDHDWNAWSVLFVNDMPPTASGKIRKAELRQTSGQA